MLLTDISSINDIINNDSEYELDNYSDNSVSNNNENKVLSITAVNNDFSNVDYGDKNEGRKGEKITCPGIW